MDFILNRLRGSGNIVFGSSGASLHGIYYFLIFGFIAYQMQLGSYLVIFGYAFAGLALYLLGESYGWGKWVGTLCHPEGFKLEKFLEDKDGFSFPYIHYLTNPFFKQENYFKYSTLALIWRGFFWWAPIYMLAGFMILGTSGIIYGLIPGVLLGLAFPLACYISTKIRFDFKIWKYECHGYGWETQEVIYGIFQSIFSIALIVLVII